MLTVLRQQHSFSDTRMDVLVKVSSFWDIKCLDLRETRTPTFGIKLNSLTILSVRMPNIWYIERCPHLWSFQGNIMAHVNSLAPGRFQGNIRLDIFKLIIVIDGFGISCEIVLIWITLHLTDVQSILVLPEALLSKFYDTIWRHYVNSFLHGGGDTMGIVEEPFMT